MKKHFITAFSLALSIVFAADTKPKLGYTYTYQGPITDLVNGLSDPRNWILDGSSPSFSPCGGGIDVPCTLTTFLDCTEPGKNHLSLDAEICLGSNLQIHFITVYIPIIFDVEYADIE